MTQNEPPIVRTDMLIHATAHEAFEAFRDPARITAFWLGHASAPLTHGARLEWEFMVPGARAMVDVRQIEPDRRIAFDWPEDGTSVAITFDPRGDRAVRVGVMVSGFSGDDAIARAIDATAGFSLVLCDLKTLLETGKSGGMVRDKAALIASGGVGSASS